MMTAKQQLRENMLAKRRALSPGEQMEASAAICQRVVELLRGYPTPACIALYTPVRGEADVRALASLLRSAGWVTAFPQTCAAPRGLRFLRVDDATSWRVARYGIPEPLTDATVAAADLDVLLVPGVAFDPLGRRVGYGGGYYDLLFADPSARGLRVGIGYAFQLIACIETEGHDQAMDVVITEDATIHSGRVATVTEEAE